MAWGLDYSCVVGGTSIEYLCLLSLSLSLSLSLYIYIYIHIYIISLLYYYLLRSDSELVEI